MTDRTGNLALNRAARQPSAGDCGQFAYLAKEKRPPACGSASRLPRRRLMEVWAVRVLNRALSRTIAAVGLAGLEYAAYLKRRLFKRSGAAVTEVFLVAIEPGHAAQFYIQALKG